MPHHKAVRDNIVGAIPGNSLRQTENEEGMLSFGGNLFINEKRGKVTNDYTVLETVGKGGYGEVKKVIHKITGETRAMKIIKKESCDDTYLKALTNEITILRMLDHPHIIKLYEIYQDTANIYMITEYMSGGEVF
jgi:calcium-dependent protein kinase